MRTAAARWGLLPAAWVLGAVTAAAAFLLPSWEARRFVLFYLAPLVPAVVLWARERLGEDARYRRAGLPIDAAVFVLAAARTATGALPFSGHMLFLTHALLTVRSGALRVFLGVLWLETAYFKLVLWDDARSWGWGLVLGVVAGVAWRVRARAEPGSVRAPAPHR